MKVDITGQPDPDIFRHRKKYILWFVFFLAWVVAALGIIVFAVYYDTSGYRNLDNFALGLLVGASIGTTWSGNRLQAYKKLFPPQLEQLVQMRSTHGVIDAYCQGVDTIGRPLIRAEYEACVKYAEHHPGAPFA
ncbi:hypothetical protein [Desulforhopalus singaporensis]|uniref:Uncharacterized protein n=1 Tax=Desulforhopalus singaporensis TaxID=91360 RepID=A0A1H0SRF9_9BACT|nr:hypothetical protein [Desulforhopalus singaporensis]SDP44225.1 hypothetical protein SAMN05660330_02784 [Desulforhopalus singaporensis]